MTQGAVAEVPPIDRGARLSWSLNVAAGAALLAPAWLLAWTAHAICNAYSSTPYSDQWVQIAAMRQTPPGGWLTFLFSQHNEHRILVSRLVFLADWNLFQGRNALNLITIGLLQLSGAALFVHAALARRPNELPLLGLAAAITLIASLLQWENLFWGFQVCFVAVYAVAAWAIYLFAYASYGDRVRWGRLAAALALLFVATFSMANGVFAGFAMALMGIVTRKRPLAIVVAATAGVILLAAYLHGYHRLENHSSVELALQHPGRFLFYVAIFLGNLWAPGQAAPAALLGLAGIAATFAMFVVLLNKADAADPVRSALFGVALFVGMSAAVTSLGRLVLGIEQAMASRYMTPTAYFWASHAVFWALTLRRERPAWIVRSPGRDLARYVWAGARVLVALALVGAIWRVASLQKLGELQLLDVSERVRSATSAILGDLDSPETIRNVYPDPAHVAHLTPSMRSDRKALFADPPVTKVGAAFSSPVTARACLGAFDSLVPQGPVLWRAAGWGWHQERGGNFARVVLVDGAGKVLGVGVGGAPRPDVARAVKQVRGETSGWSALLRRGDGREVVVYGVTPSGAACELGRRAWEP